MMKYLIFSLVFLTSCTSSVQLLETASDDLTLEEDVYVYEDELMRVTYDLWEENGDMVFTIFNKGNKPLYLDWSKSSLIKGTKSYKYWQDITILNASVRAISYESWLFPNANLRQIKGSINAIESKPEKISFIEPGTMLTRRFSPIVEEWKYNINENNFEQTSCNSKPSEQVKVYYENFIKENTPLKFRNFLTFSFDQNFTKEFYMDTEFYVSKISKMPKKHFELYRPAYSDKISYPFKKTNAFYIYDKGK